MAAFCVRGSFWNCFGAAHAVSGLASDPLASINIADFAGGGCYSGPEHLGADAWPQGTHTAIKHRNRQTRRERGLQLLRIGMLDRRLYLKCDARHGWPCDRNAVLDGGNR